MADIHASAGHAGKRPGRKRRRKPGSARASAIQTPARPAVTGAQAARAEQIPPLSVPADAPVVQADPAAAAPAPPQAIAGRGNPANRPLPFHRQAYAAIDLGTNNCRLLIARPSGDHFVVIDAFSRVVRLGEGLAQSGRLSDAAMDRALAALHICADKLRRRNVHLARSVATEACRRATNGAEFIERVRNETGIRLDIITAREEARLAVLGCHILLEHGEGPAMIFDIGGGSTEMVLVDTTDPVPRILDWQSVPWGVVSLTEVIGTVADSAEARAAAYAEMRRLVHEGFASFAERVAHEHAAHQDRTAIRLLGTSGTVTTLAGVALGLQRYRRPLIDGAVLERADANAALARIQEMGRAGLEQHPCVGADRAEFVLPGCAIYAAVARMWPAERLTVADRGLREGMLLRLIRADRRRARPAYRVGRAEQP